jgi:hypothetical protein
LRASRLDLDDLNTGHRVVISNLGHAEPQLTERDRRDTPLKIGEPTDVESGRLQADKPGEPDA